MRYCLSFYDALGEQSFPHGSMGFAQHVASRIRFMDKGALVCDVEKEEFFTACHRHNERVARFLKFIGE